MTSLPQFSPRLDERLTAEFLAHTLSLLPVSFRQDKVIQSAPALRFDKPEPPRDPDLPLLPKKVYPRPEASLVEATVRAMVPPAPVGEFVGRKAELDQAVQSLLSGRPALIVGESGTGKTALLRQIAADPRIRKAFKRVWWLDDMEDAGAAIGLALNAPGVLRANFENQPRVAREFLIANGILLLVDRAKPDEIARAVAFAPTIAIGTVVGSGAINGTVSGVGQATRVDLAGLDPENGTRLMMTLSNQSETVSAALGALVDYRPRALEIMATLLVEDGVTPEAIADLLENSGGDRLLALYAASFEALPDDYRELCRAFAASSNEWIATETVLARFEKPLVGQRALTFLEKRRFLERLDSTTRVSGNWADAITPSDQGFTPIVRPARRFLARTDGDDSAQAAALHASGIDLLEAGQDAEAETALREALALRLAGDTDHAVAETLTALARVAYLRGDDAAAIRQLEGAAERLHMLRDEESLEVVRIALSRAYRRAGRLDAALAVLGDDSSPEDLVAVFRARGDWAEAINVYERWRATEPAAVYGLAETYAQAGRYDEALIILTGNDSLDAQWLRGIVQHMQGNITKALDIYTRIRLDVPPDLRAPFARTFSRALASMGEVHDAALIVSAEGVWYEGKVARPIFARQKASYALAASFNWMIGKHDEAERAAQQAQAIANERPDPYSDALVHRVMGLIAWGQGDLESAAGEFDQEIRVRSEMTPRDDHEIGVALHNIADVQHEHGEMERAIANYRRALTHKDASRDYRSALLTRLALRETLVQTGRDADALEAGQQAVELVQRHNNVDLQLVGFTLATQIQALIQGGREPRAVQLMDDWLARLAQRVNEALSHPYWGMQALAVGLYLRSMPDTVPPNAVIPVDLAESTLKTLEAQMPSTWLAWAARRDLAAVYLRLERWDDALTTTAPLFEDVTRPVLANNEPFTLLASHLIAARAAVHLDRAEEAVAHFDAARELTPEPHQRGLISREIADLHRAAGAESHAAGRYVQALELLDRDEAPVLYIDTWVSLAYSRLRLRRFGDAIETFEQTLGIIESQPNPDPSLLASVLYDMANAHYTLGQYKRAVTTYRRALSLLDMRQQPERCVECLIAIAHCHVALEDFKQALEAYHDALQFNVLSVDQRRVTLAEQAEVFVEIGLIQSAVDTYRAALGLDGGTTVERAAIHRGLGTLYVRLNNNGQATKHFEAALALVQDDQAGITLSALGDVYRAQGQLAEAVTHYQQAIGALDRSINPVELASTQRALGEIYLGFGQDHEAQTALEAALDIEKGLAQQDGGRIVHTLHSLAQVHELRQEIDLATRRHHEALVYQDVRYTPEGYIDTLRELGRLYALQRRYTDASKAYEEALGTETNQPTPNTAKVSEMTEALADVYRAQGRLESAAKLYKQVVKVMQSQPQSPSQPQAQAQPRSVASQPPAEAPRARVAQSLQTTEADIARHIATLNAAEQSWMLLNRVHKPDLKGLVFIRALQAQACAALGRREESDQYLSDLLKLLEKRRDEVTLDDPRSVMRALAMLLQAHDNEQIGRSEAAHQAYQHALDIAEHDTKTDAALVWAIRQKAGKGANGKR